MNNHRYRWTIADPLRGIDIITQVTKWQNLILLQDISQSKKMTPTETASFLDQFWKECYYLPHITKHATHMEQWCAKMS